MILQLLTAAIEMAANPFALGGYILLGVYSQRLWHAVKYGFLWGSAILIFSIALGKTPLTSYDALALRFGLQIFGAILITVGVFYAYRAMRGGRGGRGGSGGGRSNGSRPPRLRRVK